MNSLAVISSPTKLVSFCVNRQLLELVNLPQKMLSSQLHLVISAGAKAVKYRGKTTQTVSTGLVLTSQDVWEVSWRLRPFSCNHSACHVTGRSALVSAQGRGCSSRQGWILTLMCVNVSGKLRRVGWTWVIYLLSFFFFFFFKGWLPALVPTSVRLRFCENATLRTTSLVPVSEKLRWAGVTETGDGSLGAHAASRSAGSHCHILYV